MIFNGRISCGKEKHVKELVIGARTENLDQVIAFVDENLEEADCSMKAQMQIDVAVEEIFVNIAQYAYTPAEGEAVIRLDTEKNPGAVTITFIDSGVPFNPLAVEEPDVTLSAKDRKVGGLGIFMTKNLNCASYCIKILHRFTHAHKNDIIKLACNTFEI